MCKAPKPPKPKEPKKPEFLRNRYLDEFVGDAQAVNALRTGRSSLRIPLTAPSGTTGTPTPATPVTPPNPANVPPRNGNFVQPIGPRTGGPRRQLR
jgi:hypothetical protein